MEKNYWSEVIGVTLRFLQEWRTISQSVEEISTLTENEVLNSLFPTSVLVTLLAMMNRAMTKTLKKKQITFLEFEPFLRCFFALCYYSCSVADVENHADAFPLVTKEVNRLAGNTFKQKISRLKDCLKCFEGTDMKDVDGDGLNFKPIYKRDYHLEKFLRDAGEHASQLGFVAGVRLKISFCLLGNLN